MAVCSLHNCFPQPDEKQILYSHTPPIASRLHPSTSQVGNIGTGVEGDLVSLGDASISESFNFVLFFK